MFSGKAFGRVVVATIALVGLLAAVDVVALQVFESRGGAELARGMAAEGASIDLGGFPFLPGYLRGELDDVAVDVFATTGAGLRVAVLEVTFATVKFPPGRMFSLLRTRYATRARVEGSEVFGRAEIHQSDLQAYLRSQVPLVSEVRIDETGVAVLFTPEEEPPPRRGDEEEGEEPRPAPTRYLPRVEEITEDGQIARKLVLRLVGRAGLNARTRPAAERIEGVIDLPNIPRGLQTNISLGNGVFAIEASGPEVELVIGEGDREA